MSVYASEEEQVEALKKWWKDNGRAVVTGLVLGIGIVLGWRAWVDYQEKHAQKASVAYEALLASQAQEVPLEALEKQTELLLEEYGDTAYATATRLAMAKVFIEKDKPKQAETQLRLAMEAEQAKDSQSSVALLAQLRLTRVLLDQEQLDEAWQLANGVPRTSSFEAIIEELKGDILVAQQKPEKARSAYKSALLAGPKNSRYVQMKLDDLGTVDQPEPAT